MDSFSPIIPKKFTCTNCNANVIAPKHCGKPMNLEFDATSKQSLWVCWKGEHKPCCGRDSVMDYDPCCEEPVLKADHKINPDNVLL